MPDYDITTYGEKIADVYDTLHPSQLEDQWIIATLQDLAETGPVLELGIGTGRIALPLAANGVAVHGIDASTAMVERLRAKPGGTEIPVLIGNFAEFQHEKKFSLVYVLMNTFFQLFSEDEQMQCMTQVAQHLTQKGKFLIEVEVPNLTYWKPNSFGQVTQIGQEQFIMVIKRHDTYNQQVHYQQITLHSPKLNRYPVQIRYAWPTQLDEMAQLAGLRLAARWANWQRAPFQTTSTKHVSIYEQASH